MVLYSEVYRLMSLEICQARKGSTTLLTGIVFYLSMYYSDMLLKRTMVCTFVCAQFAVMILDIWMHALLMIFQPLLGIEGSITLLTDIVP